MFQMDQLNDGFYYLRYSSKRNTSSAKIQYNSALQFLNCTASYSSIKIHISLKAMELINHNSSKFTLQISHKRSH